MKKLLISLIGLTALVASVKAQNPVPLSFLKSTVSFLVVSNKLGWTNITQMGNNSTNIAGALYTNNFAALVTVVAGSNDAYNVFQDVPLWADREGRSARPPTGTANTNAPADLNGVALYGGESFGNISVVLPQAAGNPNNTNRIKFRFTPVYDGTNGSTSVNDYFAFEVPAAGTAGVVFGTNFPSWRYPGALALRLVDITQTNGAALSNQCVIDSITFNGFRP